MSNRESGNEARVLRNDELEQVSGGIHEVDTVAHRLTNPLVIRGFNPQPDPPGIWLGA